MISPRIRLHACAPPIKRSTTFQCPAENGRISVEEEVYEHDAWSRTNPRFTPQCRFARAAAPGLLVSSFELCGFRPQR